MLYQDSTTPCCDMLNITVQYKCYGRKSMLNVLKLGLMGYGICGIYMYLIMRSSVQTVQVGNDHVVASVWVAGNMDQKWCDVFITKPAMLNISEEVCFSGTSYYDSRLHSWKRIVLHNYISLFSFFLVTKKPHLIKCCQEILCKVFKFYFHP